MDFLDFEGQDLYFDEPLPGGVAELLATAASDYAEGTAELPLLKAYFRAPESLMVLVALYRFYYYQHRLVETLRVAERAIAVSAAKLGLAADWRALTADRIAAVAPRSMSLVRFYLLSLKGAAWLKMRLGDAGGAREILEQLVALDSADRLGCGELLALVVELERGEEAEVGG